MQKLSFSTLIRRYGHVCLLNNQVFSMRMHKSCIYCSAKVTNAEEGNLFVSEAPSNIAL